jgi:CTP synthase (UTP-ammonia lyase)
MTKTAARVALVGDRSANVRAHVRIPQLFEALRERDGIALDAYWIPTPEAGARDLTGFDAIWVVPGSPYASEAGAVAAVKAAREGGIPFLGTCGGFQHAMLEYARNVCGLPNAQHAENIGVSTSATSAGTASAGTASAGTALASTASNAAELLITQLACSLVGHEEAVMVVPGTLAASIIGPGRRVERYFCAYGLNAAYLDVLAAAGLRFSGFDDDGQVRIVEIPGHPFFLGTLFQPEQYGDGTRPHPLIQAFAAAAAKRAGLASERATMVAS